MPKRCHARRAPTAGPPEDRDTAQTLVALKGTPAPNRWFPCLGRVLAGPSGEHLKGRTVGIMPPAAASKRGRSTHLSTADRRRQERRGLATNGDAAAERRTLRQP